jgi:hypothetical protein
MKSLPSTVNVTAHHMPGLALQWHATGYTAGWQLQRVCLRFNLLRSVGCNPWHSVSISHKPAVRCITNTDSDSYSTAGKAWWT